MATAWITTKNETNAVYAKAHSYPGLVWTSKGNLEKKVSIDFQISEISNLHHWHW